ncbi:MAG TPA: folylpolyglutamate synthase/dihydrofolate synthase family protein [Anaerolineales bacterium]|nr:folylpolyglutamate synthase/dihydrofolate synthase family protein [Anaerolineales bacterium]
MNDTETAYNRALDYLYSFVDYSLKHISELAKAEFNLDRMFALMGELGEPQEKYPIIHVAGTKGKGSVAALCASALQGAGYKTGLYTSPHLWDYVERIQINGEPISHQQLVKLVEEVKPAVAKIPKLTTFEITTALGFLAFAKNNANAAVIEVGLGGRLDATNIVMPKVSVITSLSYDHMAVLGNTLGKIAGEKAGIIKEGVPVVSAPQTDEALEVVERVAKEKNCPFVLVGKDVKFERLTSSLDGQSLRLSSFPPALPGADQPGRCASGASVFPSQELQSIELTIPLLGVHQIENAAIAYAALRTSGIPILDEAIQKGFAQVKWPARFEVLRREPPVIVDSAHNPDSALRLRETLDEYIPERPVILLLCALEDKDISGMLEELKPRLECVVATRADHPRAPSAAWIAEQVRQAGIPVEAVTPVLNALERALELAGEQKVVLSAGSVAFAGEVSAAWRKRTE